MTKLEIRKVTARKPEPFTTTPLLEMVLANQAGTGQHYVQKRDAGESLEMLKAEAQALETAGAIDGETLARDWTLVTGESDYDTDMAIENLIDANTLAGERDVELEPFEDEVEPIA